MTAYWKKTPRQNQIAERLPMMKLFLRIFAVLVVIAGLSAASVSSKASAITPSHLSVTGSMSKVIMMPTPGGCGGHLPGCYVNEAPSAR